jgi:hypothetical protein
MLMCPIVGCGSSDDAVDGIPEQAGDPAMRGGSPTVRESYMPATDDPRTSNDESNDQPQGVYGTVSVDVCNLHSGNCYPLDADVSGTTLSRLYFPKGGWVDFSACELDQDLNGTCEDENGTSWEIRGEQ